MRALGVHLAQGQMLPYARAAELIHDVYGLTISPATLLAWMAEARAACKRPRTTLPTGCMPPLLNADESGLRVAGKRHWLHIAASDTLTWYDVYAKRGMAAIEAHGILPNRLGVLVHDCWAPYWKLDDSINVFCNAHLLRELVYVKEITGQQWPESMMQLLLDASDVAAFRTVYTTPWCGKGKRSIPKPRDKRGSAAVTNKPSRPMRIDAALEQIVAYAVSHELGHLHPPPA